MALDEAGLQLIAGDVAGYVNGLNKADKATTGFYSTLNESGKHANGFQQVITGALREVGASLVKFGIQGAKALGGFVKESIDVAGDFEQGMHKFQAVAGDAVDTAGLEKFKDLFISLGKELPVSTSEVEQAAIEMVSGGIDPAIVAAGALRSTIQFAAASGLSLADAAATSAKFLAGWTKASATAAEKVAFLTSSTDALTKAAAASSTTAAELRLGIFNVQGAAQALHAPFTDVVATLAELAPAFESSAQAGTALNVFMTRLVPQTDKAAGVMKDLGIITATGRNIFFDSTGAFLGLGNAAEVLKDKLSGMSDAQKIATLHELFGNDAMKVGNLLMQDGAAGLDAMKAKMDAANGVSATAALMQSGYNTALENAKGSVEALQIRIGSFLIPVLTDLLNNYIAPGINAITDWVEAITSADDPLAALVQSIDSALPGFAEFATFIGQISTQLANSDWGGALDTLAQGLGDLGATFGPPLIAALDEATQMAFDWIAQQAPAWGDQLLVWGAQLTDWVAPMIPPMIDQLVDLASAAWEWVKQQAPEWGKQLQTWGQEFVAWIAPMIPPALEELGKMGIQFITWVGDQAAPLLKSFVAWKDSFIAWIGPATVAFLKEWPKMFDQFLDWVGGEAGPLLKQLGDWALSFIQWIAPMIPPFLAEVGKIAIAIGVWVIETAAVLSKKIVEVWVPAILGWIVTDAIPGLVKALDSFLRVFDGWIKDAEASLARSMIAVGTAIVSGIKQGISDAWESFSGWIHDQMMKIPEAVRSALHISSPSQVMADMVGAPIIQGITQGMQKAAPGMLQGMRDIGAQIIDGFNGSEFTDGLIGAGEDAIAALTEGMRTGMRGAVRYIESTADTLVGAVQDAFGAHSPATEFMPVGSFAVQGIMAGFQGMWPSLMGLVSDLGNDLTDQAQRIADDVQNAIADAFGATASIDRQKVNNLNAVAGLGAKQQGGTQQQLNAVEQEALAMTDPKQAQQWFALRSKQIIELAKLNDQIQAESDTKAKEQLQARYDLINAANNAEISQFQTKAQSGGTQDITAAIQKLMMDSGLGILDSPVMGQLFNLLGQLQSQPATGFGSTSGASNSYSQSTTLNMPVYTNMSTGAIQSSLAIAGAALP